MQPRASSWCQDGQGCLSVVMAGRTPLICCVSAAECLVCLWLDTADDYMLVQASRQSSLLRACSTICILRLQRVCCTHLQLLQRQVASLITADSSSRCICSGAEVPVHPLHPLRLYASRWTRSLAIQMRSVLCCRQRAAHDLYERGLPEGLLRDDEEGWLCEQALLSVLQVWPARRCGRLP